MRILITGGAGFLGTHLVELLLQERHHVTILDIAAPPRAHGGVRVIQADVRDPLDEIFAESRPEVVVHLAAQVSVPASVADPGYDQSVNVGGTVNVVSAAARCGARKVVTVSSAAVYGHPAELPLTEKSPTSFLSPYGLSKLTAEHYTRLLCETWRLPFTILRPANLYGPGQAADGEGAVVPSFLNAFLAGRDPVIQGDGSQTRDFLHVADMTLAIRCALTQADNMTLNVSSGQAVSVLELWQVLARMVGWSRPPMFGPARAGDIAHSVLANEAAKQTLHWAPRISLPEGLSMTVSWAEAALAREA